MYSVCRNYEVTQKTGKNWKLHLKVSGLLKMRYIVASHECLGRAVAVGTWVVVVIVHGKSANQGIYWCKDHRKECCSLDLPSRTESQQKVSTNLRIHSQSGWVSLTPTLVHSSTVNHTCHVARQGPSTTTEQLTIKIEETNKYNQETDMYD